MMLGPRTCSSPTSPSGTERPSLPTNLPSPPGKTLPIEVSVRGDSGRVIAIVGEHSVTPYPLCSTIPNRDSVPDFVAASRGAPEEVIIRRAGKFRDDIFLNLAYCSS